MLREVAAGRMGFDAGQRGEDVGHPGMAWDRQTCSCRKRDFAGTTLWQTKEQDRSMAEYGLLAFGAFFLVLGSAGTYSGEAWGRFGQVFSRGGDPNRFWEAVGMQLLLGVCAIGYFLYKNS